MNLGEILKKVDDYECEIMIDGIDPVVSVVVEPDTIILKTENPLNHYYEHKAKLDILNKMIESIRLDENTIGEIELVKIAHNLELDLKIVENEFRLNEVNVEEI